MYLSLCDWPQQMNNAFIPTSPPRSLPASEPEYASLSKVGHGENETWPPRLITSILSHAGHTTSNTWGMGHIQVSGRRLWMSFYCGVSQWKVCCGQTELQSWQDICQDVCPFRSRLAAVALKMLISSVQAQRSVLHCQGFVVFTFPFAKYSSLTHSQSFASSNILGKLRSKMSC